MRIRRPLLLSNLLVCSSLLPPILEALPLCTDLRAPVMLNFTLKFCANDGRDGTCCDAAADAALQRQFNAMDVKPDSGCGRLVKSILCAKCNPFSADLFDNGSTTRTVPILCSSFSAQSSFQSKNPIHPKGDYCQQVWKYCKSTPISNSPFQRSVLGDAGIIGASSMLTDFWLSENDFCACFSGTTDKQPVCFNGHGVSFNTRKPSPSPTGMCLEKIGNGSYLNMVAHPDGSSKAFFSRQDGKIWLATVPELGRGDSLQLDETNPFLDLTTEDHLNSELGLVGLAFHPHFAYNGRFFVSYICDGTQSPKCAGRCSCYSEVGCDPLKLGSVGFHPCQYQLVVSEYSAKGSSSNFFEATYAYPSEVRRIFSMGLTYVSNHAGQLLFGPTDGYLYFFTGNGGKKGDPFNFSQNKKSLLGKIMRLNIDDLPELNEVASQRLWGYYTIPKDNPNADDSNLQPEIWALGLGNPGRCSFDSARPFHLYCADDGQQQYKVVDLISKGGNYGWGAVYEDRHVHYPPWAAQGTKPTDGVIFPVMGYKVSSVAENIESASLVGGYVYRGSSDPFLYGRYLFADMHTSAMWTGTDNTDVGGKFTSTPVLMSCSEKTPIPCDESTTNPVGSIFSFGEDNKKDVFILASQGVFRVVHPTLCHYAGMNSATTKGATPSASHGYHGAVPAAVKMVEVVLSDIGALTAAGLVWKCSCNIAPNCCNCIQGTMVNNNHHGGGDGSPVAPSEPGDIELGTGLAEYYAP